MRRTKAALICKATRNLRAVQILLGHTNIENTVRYLGVDVDDALTLSRGGGMSTEIRSPFQLFVRRETQGFATVLDFDRNATLTA